MGTPTRYTPPVTPAYQPSLDFEAQLPFGGEPIRCEVPPIVTGVPKTRAEWLVRQIDLSRRARTSRG